MVAVGTLVSVINALQTGNLWVVTVGDVEGVNDLVHIFSLFLFIKSENLQQYNPFYNQILHHSIFLPRMNIKKVLFRAQEGLGSQHPNFSVL